MGPMGPMGPGGPMNSSSGMSNSGSPMDNMNSPMGPNGPMPGGPNGPMPGGPMGGMGGPNPMMVPCSKSSPMGMSGGPNGPDPTQPLPPSGLSGNGFNKNSPIMGGPNPATSDPNYAQQFHNFQQQLYATNTRSQGAGLGPGGHSPGYPHRSNTPPGFNQNWQPSGPLSK